MINSLAFSKAVAIHHQITDHNPNAFVVARQDTPVANLVAPVIAPALFYDDQSDDFKSVASIASMLERNAVIKEGTDTHEMSLRNFVSLASETVRRTVYLTKTVALPVIEDITTRAEDRLNEVSGGTGLALNILPDTQSDILLNPTLVSAIQGFTSVAGLKTSTVNVHDPRDSAQLVELMRVGYDAFDKEMEAWMAAHVSADIVSNVYNKVFSSAGTPTYISNVFDTNVDNYPEALICFLLARGLSLNPDDNINMSANDYDSAMALVSNYSAGVVRGAMKRFDNVDKFDRVVLRYPPLGQELSFDRPEQGVIVVNKITYERFLEQGGSPEAIMGSYLLDRQTDAPKLLENRDQYINHYNARVLKTRSDDRVRVIVSMRRFLESAVANEIVNTSNENTEEQGLWKGITINPEAAQRILRKCIDRLVLEDMDDMYSTVRDIILEVFFADTDVGKLIQLVDANSKDNPEDLKSAVNVSIVDYIVDWFIHQTTLCTQ